MFQEFHLHLRLPTSVRRFEQFELRPVLYNYQNRDLTVRPMGACALRAGGKGGCCQGQGQAAVLTGLGLWPSLFSCPQVSVHVSPVEGMCMAGGGGLAQQVSVPAGSARPVAFSVVPTAAASVSLKVVARGSVEDFVGDAVSKILQIEVSDCP